MYKKVKGLTCHEYKAPFSYTNKKIAWLSWPIYTIYYNFFYRPLSFNIGAFLKSFRKSEKKKSKLVDSVSSLVAVPHAF